MPNLTRLQTLITAHPHHHREGFYYTIIGKLFTDVVSTNLENTPEGSLLIDRYPPTHKVIDIGTL